MIKRIALISHSAHLHGAERMLLNLALLLKQHQDFHPILVLPGQGDFSEVAQANGLQCVISLNSPWYIYGNTPTYFQDVQASRELIKKILINTQTDSVIINTLTSISAMLAAVQLNLPTIVWVHGVIDASMIGPRDSQFVYWNENFLLHTASALVANSKWTGSFYESMLNISGIKVIPNWTDLEPSFVVKEGKYQSRSIACLNTFEKNKGHVVLIEAARLLQQKDVNFRLDLYGIGPEQMKIMEMCKKYDLESKVHFIGVTQDPHQAYDSAAIVVNPSYVESFGMTLIEAMARKTPVIATRSGGPEDVIVDGKSGYLINKGDFDDLAKHLELILEAPLQAQQMGEEAYLRVQERFSINSASSEFEYLINSTIQNHRSYQPINLNDTLLFEWLSNGKPLLVNSTLRNSLAAWLLERCPPYLAKILRYIVRFFAKYKMPQGDIQASNSFVFENLLAARSAVRLVKKLEYNLSVQFPRWVGFEFMIGTNNQVASGQIEIEILDLADGVVIRRKTLEMKDVQDNQVVLVEFEEVSESTEKDYTVRFIYQPFGVKSLISIYETNNQESKIKRVLRRLGLLTYGSVLACRLLYVEE